jgi:ABC-type spermidine/putrescine transport system permease subunit II
MKYLLVLVLAVFIVPIFSVVCLSFTSTGGHPGTWYIQILENENFLSALSWSVGISFITMLLSTGVSFIISLVWFNGRQIFFISILLLIFGLLPPDIISLALTRSANTLGFFEANVLLLVIGLTLYCLPFSVMMLWARYYFIDSMLVLAARDVGMNKLSIITRIIMPLSLITIISCLLVNFLLVFNEFPRTYYLSGSNVLLSEFLGGKLNSGADNSIYAGGSLLIYITCVLVFVLAFLQRRRLVRLK